MTDPNRPSAPEADVPSSDLPVPASALVIAAHPDDAEFLAGATLAKWSRHGTVVHHLVLTDGSKGTWDAEVDQAVLIERRRTEQTAAAAALGATGEVIMLGETDGELATGVEIRSRVARIIRTLRPSVILGHDPWKRYRLHPDHRAAGHICVEALVAARDPFFHPDQLDEGLDTHRPDALLLFEADEVNHVEHVSDADANAKVAALEAHASQLETTHLYRVRDHNGDPLQAFRDRERALLGSPLAERYHLIVDQL